MRRLRLPPQGANLPLIRMNTVDNARARPDHARDARREAPEQRTSDRLWAYSDAVFAVIVTIMVLQLRPPASDHLSALLRLWPTAISYVVSYVFIAIIWINHHYLTRFISNPSLGLMWTNFLHLLLVSLLPFTTAWIAQTRMATAPMILYAGLFLCAASAFNVLEHHILKTTPQISQLGRRTARRRSLLALGVFALATVAATLQAWLGFVLVCTALALHIKPDVGSGRAASPP